MSRPQNSYTNDAFCQKSEFLGARCKSPNRRQSPVGAQTVHILDTSICSIQAEPLPPRPGHKPVKYSSKVYDEEQEFFEEMILDDQGTVHDKKFVVIHNQSSDNCRYEYIPMQQHQRVASPAPKVLYHEEVDASTGRLHRYATIPSDEESEDEQQPSANVRYALVPVEEVNAKGRYAVVNIPDERRYDAVDRTAKSHGMSPQPRFVPPNPVATQKLHELLTTPRKKTQHFAPSRKSTSPSSPLQPIRTPVPSARAQQKLNYTLGAAQIQDNKRHTAIVAPICSRPVQPIYSGTNFTHIDSNVASLKSPMQATIAIAAFMMILCGCVTTGLCIYMISFMGRLYYLDFSILAGFACFLLGLLGFRSRHVFWLPNRNYLSGYFVLSVFSLLTCIGLLVLLFIQPKPGTLLADMTSGAVCGISGLSLFLASIGIVASYCCHAPPPDNRVQHCSPGFNV